MKIMRTKSKDIDLGKVDMLLSPRIARYVIIKTEHEDRLNLPSTYWGFVGEGLRYTVSEVLRFGTLNLLNWPCWKKYAPEDPYKWLTRSAIYRRQKI